MYLGRENNLLVKNNQGLTRRIGQEDSPNLSHWYQLSVAVPHNIRGKEYFACATDFS